MAECDSSDFDLLWYLEKLSRKECHSLRNLLGQECMEIGLPPIPRLELSEEKPDLANQLTASYEAQHLWNLMYNIFHKIPRKDLCETIAARRNHVYSACPISKLLENCILPPCRTIRSLAHWRDVCTLLHTRESLWELELRNTDLDDTSDRVLCKALSHPDCQLRTLRLTYFPVDTRFEDMFKAIVHNRNLTCLCLSCMPISLKVFSLLHEVFANPMCSIQHLSLMKCDLEASAYKELASLLISSKKLKKLTLSKNALSRDGMKIFCDALFHPNCVLEWLVLLFCSLTLRSLSLIARCLVLTKTLKHLDVSVNNIRDNGVLVLMMALVFRTCSVRELEISGCFFTAKACEYMVYVLQNNPNLQSLELGSNNIGDAGMELLCDAMKHPNCNLESIGLEECMLTGACCASLASILISRKTLKKINLLGNKLGDEGIAQLLEGLGHPDCVLQTVGLHVKDLNAETMTVLTTVTNRNPHLHVTDQSWAKKKGREVSCNLGDVSLSRSILRLPDLPWQLLSSDSSRNQPPL